MLFRSLVSIRKNSTQCNEQNAHEVLSFGLSKFSPAPALPILSRNFHFFFLGRHSIETKCIVARQARPSSYTHASTAPLQSYRAMSRTRGF